MRRTTLEPKEVSAYGSLGVEMTQVLRLDGDVKLRTHVAVFDRDGVLGQHAALSWQLFLVLTGRGWVRTEDEDRQDIGPGEAVVWAPGEVHESGTSDGMTALIVQSSREFEP